MDECTNIFYSIYLADTSVEKSDTTKTKLEEKSTNGSQRKTDKTSPQLTTAGQQQNKPTGIVAAVAQLEVKPKQEEKNTGKYYKYYCFFFFFSDCCSIIFVVLRLTGQL